MEEIEESTRGSSREIMLKLTVWIFKVMERRIFRRRFKTAVWMPGLEAV